MQWKDKCASHSFTTKTIDIQHVSGFFSSKVYISVDLAHYEIVLAKVGKSEIRI